MEDVIFNNVKLKKDTYYFLYVGEIKGCCLNEYLRFTLQELKKQPVEFISIVPDVWERYYQDNLIVVNPVAAELSKKAGKLVHARIPGKQFVRFVTAHPLIRDLFNKLVSNQGELFVHMFQTFPEIVSADLPNLTVIGPDPKLSNLWNSKLFMYRKLQSIIPLPPFHFCESRENLLETTRRLWKEWEDGIFVSLEYSAAGAFSFMARSEDELIDKLGDWKPPYLVTKFIPHKYDPTVLGVVANEGEVFIGCVADQCMEQVNKFRGSTFPSVLPEEVQDSLKEITRKVGREMAKIGYRGIFGCDYVIDDEGNIYFVEVNARKQGTTMEMCCTLENSLPDGCPNLMEIEFFAITQKRLPPGCMELKGNPFNIYWGTYNHKVEKDVKTCRGLEDPGSERKMYERVVRGHQKKSEHMVVEHVGRDVIVKVGSFLGRVISVGKDRESMLKGLNEGKLKLRSTIEGAI
ncbi:MAG TPA: ATP-grasp domain-containing protein [Deltaproteobacteria bacterium]|nr:ATP-grasp domain-containing protein [Deltaproteobacteria bacterium]